MQEQADCVVWGGVIPKEWVEDVHERLDGHVPPEIPVSRQQPLGHGNSSEILLREEQSERSPKNDEYGGS